MILRKSSGTKVTLKLNEGDGAEEIVIYQKYLSIIIKNNNIKKICTKTCLGKTFFFLSWIIMKNTLI